jgi:outer membrane beta-barrel protein
MKRLALGLLVVLANLSVGRASLAQEPEGAASAPDTAGGDQTPTPPAGAAGGAESGGATDTGAAAGGEIDLGDLGGGEGGETAAEPTKKAADANAGRKSWEDIVVVPRKAFLKKSRVELAPFAGITLNDPLIRHYSLGGDLSYYITDVLSIGVQGQYFIKELSERESLVGLQYYLVPTLNKLKYHYALQMGYVPGYGKFGLFNKWIVHWDLTFALGVGMIKTEIIPRRFGDASFTNDDIAAHVGVGVRVFVLDWLTLNLTFRDYIYKDVFEWLGRHKGDEENPDIATVKRESTNSQSQLVQNIMMFFSIGFYIPPSFTYRTPR